MKQKLKRQLPTPLLNLAARVTGNFRVQEQLCMVDRPWHAYGLLRGADACKSLGLTEMLALEWGVANGRGLRNIIEIAERVTMITGVKIHVFGFDTGAGLPPPADYRDHPELWQSGDYPMQDRRRLLADIHGKADLIQGNIAETMEEFSQALRPSAPVGFVSVDLDLYTSTAAALGMFGHPDPRCFLAITPVYFDDCTGMVEYTRFCGELLAIEEFNQAHECRKIDIDRGVRQRHSRIQPQEWFNSMYNLHVLDHPWRSRPGERSAKVIAEYTGADARARWQHQRP